MTKPFVICVRGGMHDAHWGLFEIIRPFDDENVEVHTIDRSDDYVTFTNPHYRDSWDLWDQRFGDRATILLVVENYDIHSYHATRAEAEAVLEPIRTALDKGRARVRAAERHLEDERTKALNEFEVLVALSRQKIDE